MKIEFERIKFLKERNGYWIESSRLPNTSYQNDPINTLKCVGKNIVELFDQMNIGNIGDLKWITSQGDVILPDKLSRSKLI